MSSYRTLIVARDAGVATITLNRPAAANAIDLTMAQELHDAVRGCGEDDTIRAVVLTGKGRFFCAGGDLKSFAGSGEAVAGHLRDVTMFLHAAISRLARMNAPVLAAVNGIAAGAGMSLACAVDLAIAAESARFTMAYGRAGLSPDGSGTYALPRLVGLRRALELTLTNRMLSADEAEAWGLVNQVVPDSELQARAAALGAQLASQATLALAAAKRLLRESWTQSLETQMELEASALSECARSHDGREGIAAFIAKREPKF